MSKRDASSHPHRCLGCDEPLEFNPEAIEQTMKCSKCGTDNSCAPGQSYVDVIDDTALTSGESEREIAFDKLRIQHFTALRMGAIRARSWWLIAAIMCALITLDMTGKTVVQLSFRPVLTWQAATRVVVAIFAIVMARYAYSRAARFKKEIDKSALPEPTIPPDFSTLDNGSERWKHLENVR